MSLNSIKNNNSRHTIGFLLDFTNNQYHLTMLKEISEYTKKNNINLICFEGGAINSNSEYEKNLNKLYDIVNNNYLDGIIILASTISHYCDYETIEKFCNKFKPLPTVTIGKKIKNIPGVLLDNKIGMKKLMEHLIHKHKFKKFAFIKGTKDNFDAEERYKIFTEVLKKNKIPICKNMIIQGNFSPDDGKNAVRILIDELKVKFDVLVSSNDYIAISAIKELKNRGFEVPFDIAVVGFDDLDICQNYIPALTTVAQPINEQGKMAIKTLIDIINKKKTPQKIFIPTELIIRDSCSYFCSGESNEKNIISIKTISNKTNTINYIKIKYFKKIIDFLKSSLPYQSDLNMSLIENILTSFLDSIEKNNKEIFFKLIIKIINDELFGGEKTIILKSLIESLHQIIIPLLSNKKKRDTGSDICFHFNLLLVQKVAQEKLYMNDDRLSTQWALNILLQDLSLSIKKTDQISILVKRLPELGIKKCSLLLFTNNNKDEAKLVLSFDETGEKNVNNIKNVILTEKLIPDGIIDQSNNYSYIVEYLNDIGIILIELLPIEKSSIYRTLREYISNAIKGTNLLEKLEEQKNHLSNNLNTLRRAMEGYIETMALILETRDPYTAGHQRRVSDLARSIACEMDMDKDIIECVRISGMVHDLGKVGVPSEILNKPGKLLDIEFSLIKDHPSIAYEVLKKIDFPWDIAEIVYQHHEKLDGSGYPQGLKNDQIRIEAKILSVADVVEAMISHRPYRPALGIDKALEEILKNKGIKYDPVIVDVCLKLFIEKNFVFRQN